jgi:hypothetical protein
MDVLMMMMTMMMMMMQMKMQMVMTMMMMQMKKNYSNNKMVMMMMMSNQFDWYPNDLTQTRATFFGTVPSLATLNKANYPICLVPKLNIIYYLISGGNGLY